MNDGSVFYTLMYFNLTGSDCILSPQAICTNSNVYLTKWTQEGSTCPPNGNVIFYNKYDKPVIQLEFRHRNGLFYTTTETLVIDNIGNRHDSARHKTGKRIGIDEEALFDWEYLANATSNLNVEVPTNDPRRLQLEAYLWQARLGHCGEWQLKVIPHAVDGTPAHFNPHPFSTYDHYNRARIRKIPATKGKHPSRATDKQQRFYMDFGFLRASNFDYSRPGQSEDQVIQSFDGFNSYLLIVDEYTKFIWVFLCSSKEPLLDMVHLHLEIFGRKQGGSLRCNQGGELARSHDFVAQMVLRQYTVEPTGADNPAQNKAAEK